MKAAASYFAIVFALGFVLGPVRVLLVEPRIGTRAAELSELPLMLVAIILTARRMISRHPHRPLRTGLVALALLLGAEVSVGMALRQMSLVQVLFDRDPVSGTAYYASLAIFAIMPWWLTRQKQNRQRESSVPPGRQRSGS